MSVKKDWKPFINTKETISNVLEYPIVAIPERGLTKETCQHFGVRSSVCEEDGKTITATYFPITKRKVLVGFQKRDWTVPKDSDGHFTMIGKVDTSCDLFGLNVAPTGAKKSFTHEGNFDAMASWQACKKKYPSGNPACVAVISTSWATKQVAANKDFYSNFTDNVFVFDQDQCTPEELKKGIIKGKEATANIFKMMPNILVASFSEKDANKMILEGKDEELYWALIAKPKPYVPEEIKFGSDITTDDLISPIPDGLKVNTFPILMKKLRGLRKPELTIILAPTKSGKSSICRELGYGIIKQGGFLGNLFLEEDMKKTCQAYICLDNNTLLPAFRENPSIIPKEKVEASRQKVLDNGRTVFLEASKISPAVVLDKMRYMAAIGAEYIILDHLSYVFSGTQSDNERKEIDLLLHELAAFKKEANVHVIVVAHIRRKDFKPKTDKDSGEVIFPYWIPVNKEDGRGSGAFEQLCDNLIVIEPEIVDNGKRGRIRLKVEANREWDDTGIADVIIMDRSTGRMVNAEDEF